MYKQPITSLYQTTQIVWAYVSNESKGFKGRSTYGKDGKVKGTRRRENSERRWAPWKRELESSLHWATKLAQDSEKWRKLAQTVWDHVNTTQKDKA